MAHEARPFPVQSRREAPPATILPLLHLQQSTGHSVWSQFQHRMPRGGWGILPLGLEAQNGPRKANKQPEMVIAGERKPWRSLAEENFPSDDRFFKWQRCFNGWLQVISPKQSQEVSATLLSRVLVVLICSVLVWRDILGGAS